MGADWGATVAVRSAPITLEEWKRKLESDPEWVAHRDARKRDRAEQTRKLRAVQRPLIAELGTVGIHVESVWDLVNTARPYPAAIPVLLRHLFLPYPDRIREGIGRALAVKDARLSAWDVLIRALKAGTLKAGAATGAIVALSVMARTADLETVCELLRDSTLGSNRVFFVRNLTRSKQQAAAATLLELQNDPDLTVEINRWLEGRKKRKTR